MNVTACASPSHSNRPDLGLAVLRIVVGIVFLAHGAQELFDLGPAVTFAALVLAGPGAYSVDAKRAG
jgi:uncharacterized membrane protein YphA (DoxX/SURF4 family)